MADIKHVNLNAGTGIKIIVDANGETLTISAEDLQEKFDALESRVDSAIENFESRLTRIEEAIGMSDGTGIGTSDVSEPLARYIRNVVFATTLGLIDYGTGTPEANANSNAEIYLKHE